MKFRMWKCLLIHTSDGIINLVFYQYIFLLKISIFLSYKFLLLSTFLEAVSVTLYMNIQYIQYFTILIFYPQKNQKSKTKKNISYNICRYVFNT
jgi:hypothetical protein